MALNRVDLPCHIETVKGQADSWVGGVSPGPVVDIEGEEDAGGP